MDSLRFLLRLRNICVVRLFCTMSPRNVVLVGVSILLSTLLVGSVNGFVLLESHSRGRKHRIFTIHDPATIRFDQSRFLVTLRAGLGDSDSDEREDDAEDDIYNDDLIYFTEFTPNLSDNGDKAYSHQRIQHHEGGTSVDNDSRLLQRLLAQQRMKVLDELMIRPPNTELCPVEFVSAVLSALLDPDKPLPDSGFRLLLRSSSSRWRSLVRCSVGAPDDAVEDTVVRALSNAIGRPSNHFGILVGSDDSDRYRIAFPNEVIYFRDGKCLVECCLRGHRDNELLVSMGWLLKRRKDDGAWLIDHIDWKDFRDGYQYRP